MKAVRLHAYHWTALVVSFLFVVILGPTCRPSAQSWDFVGR